MQQPSYTAVQLEGALNAMHGRHPRFPKLTLRQASVEFGVPRSTLHDKFSGKTTQQYYRKGPGTLFSAAEEQILENYVSMMADRHLPVDKSALMDEANKILEKESAEGHRRPFFSKEGSLTKVGKSWWDGFRKRHPNLKWRKTEGITQSRSSITEESIRHWFRDLHSFIASHNLQNIYLDPARCFNLDETGILLSNQSGKVLAPSGCKNVLQKTVGDGKEQLTVLVNGNAEGRFVPPLFVMPYKRIPSWLESQLPKDEVYIGLSESGWMTTEVLYEYIMNCFVPWLDSSETPRPIIMFTDLHSTRLNYHLVNAARENGIILYGLPPNSTHVMQPLDVAFFRPLKALWRKAANHWAKENPNEKMTKQKFISAFFPVYKEATKAVSLQRGFEAAGLYPINENRPHYGKLGSQTKSTTVMEDVPTIYGVDRSSQTEKTLAFSVSCQTKKVMMAVEDVLGDVEALFDEHGICLLDIKRQIASGNTSSIEEKIYEHFSQKLNDSPDSRESSISPQNDDQPLDTSVTSLDSVSRTFRTHRFFPSPKRKIQSRARNSALVPACLSSNAAIATLKKRRLQKKAKECKSAAYTPKPGTSALSSVRNLKTSSQCRSESNTISNAEQILRDRIGNFCGEIEDTPADGDCLFHAISRQINKTLSPSELRKLVANFLKNDPILENGEPLTDFIEGDVDQYIQSIQRKGTWGDHICIVSLCKALRRNVIVISSKGEAYDQNLLCGSPEAGDIVLGHVAELHYVSVIFHALNVSMHTSSKKRSCHSLTINDKRMPAEPTAFFDLDQHDEPEKRHRPESPAISSISSESIPSQTESAVMRMRENVNVGSWVVSTV